MKNSSKKASIGREEEENRYWGRQLVDSVKTANTTTTINDNVIIMCYLIGLWSLVLWKLLFMVSGHLRFFFVLLRHVFWPFFFIGKEHGIFL